jgi:hypothetical protein
MMYLDLAELPLLFKKRWFWSANHFSLAWFRRQDHFGNPDISLDTSVRDLIESHTGVRPSGPIRLLTHLRYFGYCFNPVSLYYCYDHADTRIETVVAEVSNTPWGERHCYVLNETVNPEHHKCYQYKFEKTFHVSPFMPMKQDYKWNFTHPARSLAVHMKNFSQENKQLVFDATLTMNRQELTNWNMSKTLFNFPIMTSKVILAIYYQALKMWIRRFTFFDHPKHTSQPSINMEAPKSAKSQ